LVDISFDDLYNFWTAALDGGTSTWRPLSGASRSWWRRWG